MIENQNGKGTENLLILIGTDLTEGLGKIGKDRKDMTDLTAMKGNHIGGIGKEQGHINAQEGQGVDLGLHFHLGMLSISFFSCIAPPMMCFATFVMLLYLFEGLAGLVAHLCLGRGAGVPLDGGNLEVVLLLGYQGLGTGVGLQTALEGLYFLYITVLR